MKSKCLRRLSLLILLLSLTLGLGCSAVKSTYRLGTKTAKSLTGKLKSGEEPALKKRVLLPHLIDQAGIGQERTAQLTKSLAALLQQDSHLLINTFSEPLPVGDNIQSPQYGVVIEPSLTEKAKEMGMDVLLLGTINPFESTVKKTGIWPLRKVKREMEISVALNALDITNGTLFLTRVQTREVKIEVEESENPGDDKSVDFKYLEDPFVEIMEDHASELIFELDSLPWEGKITLADNGALRIKGGMDIGVVKGQIFEAFGKGESILAADGREYHIRGGRIGDLRADAVMQDYSVLVPLNDAAFEEGQIVRVKR